MKDKRSMKIRQARASIPFHDYSAAIKSAVSWLGSRYLLAAPIHPHPPAYQQHVWYLQSDHWLHASKVCGG